MKQLTEYSAKSLYGFFKPEEICFVIERNYDEIDESSSITDDLEEAKKLAKEDEYQIFIYRKKFGKDCFDADCLFEDMINNVKYDGLDLDCLESEKQEFIRITTEWFNKVIGNYWFAGEFMGVLKDEG